MTPSLLIVEDEQSSLLALKFLFRKLGPRIICAATGAEAASIIAQEGDGLVLVVSDVRLSDGSASQITRVLKEQAPKAWLILMSGTEPDDSLVQDAMIEGAVFLQKPIDLDVLERTVREAMERNG